MLRPVDSISPSPPRPLLGPAASELAASPLTPLTLLLPGGTTETSHARPPLCLVDPHCDGALRLLLDESRDRKRVGAAVMRACHALAEADPGFAVSHSHRFSQDCWLPIAESGCGAFELKPGVAPSEAILDVTAHPDRYAFDCGTAMVIVYYMAMLDLVGAEIFDQVCADLEVGPWWLERDLADHLEGSGDSSKPASAGRKRELQPGDHTYFRNWDVSEEARSGGWGGENVIYLGGDRYYGHPFGITTGAKIVAHLNERRRPEASTSAALTDFRMWLDTDILHLEP